MIRCDFQEVAPGLWKCPACGAGYRGERKAIGACKSPLSTPALAQNLGQAPSPNPGQPWQEWREEDGRWVARGQVPPGYAADAPQFAPLADEVQFTPAFPVEELQER